MKKTELVTAMAVASGMSKKNCEVALNAFVSEVTKTLKAGEKVQLVGFGTFETREHAERVGRNPRTKEIVKIAASKSPAFKAGKALKDAVK